jgi:signal transduction histidine kinase
VLNWTITKLLKVGLGSAKAPEQLERIAHSSDRLNGLIDELAKTYVEPSPDERASSSPAVCDLNEIVDNCCKMLRTLAEERQSEIEGLTSTTPTKVNARALEMSRAIDNLVRNALLHNKPGCTVKVTVQPGSDSHKVTVTDNGQGIAPEHLDKIFEAGFSTNSAASSKSSDHQGLGLHIVKTLVEATGGSIQVESQLAQGTTFTITLPSADLPVSAPSMPETTTAPN